PGRPGRRPQRPARPGEGAHRHRRPRLRPPHVEGRGPPPHRAGHRRRLRAQHLARMSPLEVFAADEQDEEPVDATRWMALAKSVLAAQGVRGDTEVSLLFVDQPAMAELNLRFLDKEGPTDVLAFPIDEEDAFERTGPRIPDS